MKRPERTGSCFLWCALVCLFATLAAFSEASPPSGDAAAQHPSAARDGQHDFDWQLGTWKIHMHRLKRPLTGSTEWTDLDGTVVVRKIWDGRANLAEIVVDGPSGHLEFLSLRLYNPVAHQWSSNFASSNRRHSRRAYWLASWQTWSWRILRSGRIERENDSVRFVFEVLSADSTRDEQAFSG